jgi:methoxymalonate biosynthesis acyl carrier protein
MSTPPTLHDRIAALFSDALHVEVPSAEADLFEAGVLDSLAFVELLVGLEREFGVRASIDDLEIDHFRSLARIEAFVAARVPSAVRLEG